MLPFTGLKCSYWFVKLTTWPDYNLLTNYELSPLSLCLPITGFFFLSFCYQHIFFYHNCQNFLMANSYQDMTLIICSTINLMYLNTEEARKKENGRSDKVNVKYSSRPAVSAVTWWWSPVMLCFALMYVCAWNKLWFTVSLSRDKQSSWFIKMMPLQVEASSKPLA